MIEKDICAENMGKKVCTLILGMDRSGGSVLASCLKLLGFNPGDLVMKGSKAEQSEYFENKDITLVHDILLRDLGCTWDMIGSFPTGWEESQEARKASNTLSDILNSQFLNRDVPFVIRDPRISRLMPLWDRVLADMNVRSSLILVMRHPMEVAKALQKRQSFDLLKSHLLWLLYNREAFAACRNREYIWVTFDQLLADPVMVLSDVLHKSSGSSVLAGVDPIQHAGEIQRFVEYEFNNYMGGESAEKKEPLFQPYAWVYDQLCSLHGETGPSLLHKATDDGSFPQFMPIETGGLPLAVSAPRMLPEASDHRQMAEVFDNLLSIIGSYEQARSARGIQHQGPSLAGSNAAEVLYAQVYFPDSDFGTGLYTEEKSKKILLVPGEWQQIHVDIPDPSILRKKRLRIDPLNILGMVSITDVKLINAATGHECWSIDRSYSGFTVKKDALVLAEKDVLQIVVTGNNPRVLLPVLLDLPDCPMYLKMWIKVARSQGDLHGYRQKMDSLHKKLENEKNQLKDSLRSKDQSLQDNENLIREYFHALAEVEAERAKLVKEIDDLRQDNEKLKDLREENTRLWEWMRHLHRHFLLMLDSRRWRLADALGRCAGYLPGRSSSGGSVERMHEIFTEFETYPKSAKASVGPGKERHNGHWMIKSMERLEKDFKAVMRSRSWRIGNSIVNFLARLLQRKRTLTSVDRMQRIFNEFQEWKQTVDTGAMTLMDIERLKRWMEALDKKFQALFASRRWKLGRSLSAPVRIFRRPEKPGVVDRVNAVFKKYNVGIRHGKKTLSERDAYD